MTRVRFFRTFSLGAVFCIVTSLIATGQTFKTLYSFNSTNYFPGNLVQGRNGTLYTDSGLGGTHGWGSISNVSFNGVSAIYNFCSLANCADGSYPMGVVLGADGNLYGTTFSDPTVFKVTPAGSLTTLHTFCSEPKCADGSGPESGLTQAANGSFYGVSFYGGNSADGGTLFEINSTGKFNRLYQFCSQSGCTDGASPNSAPIQGSDGNFYGTTAWGGAYNLGTVYVLTVPGQPQTLYSFTSGTNWSVGPSHLIQANDGNIYGLTSGGGATGYGSVFRITPGSGQFSTVYDFCSQSNCMDGYSPTSLLQGPDGNFYGTTGGGGTGSGTVFKLTADGILTTLHNFCQQAHCLDGSEPLSLTLATNGTLYGTASSGGKSGDGTLFSLDIGFMPFVQANPIGGQTGSVIGVLGNGLTGATSVTFNGVPATAFSVISDTFLRASVPLGATTGAIQVTTPTGSLTSIVNFQVR